jgi:hypothetical protein
MEKPNEVLMREALGKRSRRDPEAESHQFRADEGENKEVLARIAWEEAFWDDLEQSYGARPVRRDTEHAETKASWRKMDLATASQKAAAAWSEDEEDDDDPDREALRFRKRWNYIWSEHFGSFEDTTLIPPMRFTDEPPVERLYPSTTLQIFSAKVAGIGGGFQWPLDVFGLVAIRDSVDENRNIIFQRSRDECQTITGEDPYLELTGPTRAVVLWDPLTIEVYLRVKGPSELEDKTLCFLAEGMICLDRVNSCLLHETWTSKYSTMEFTLGHINASVEATISVRVVDGSWPDGFHGQFVACLVGTHWFDEVPAFYSSTSVDDKEIVLLSFGDEKVPAVVDGVIELSRRVVSVETTSKLKVSVNAWQDDNNAVEAWEEFSAKERGRSFGTLDVGFCKMDVIVGWSLVTDYREPRR